MTNITSELINKIVLDQIDKNKSAILNNIVSGADDTMSTEQVFVRMISNSIQVSVELSVKIVTELLYHSQVVAEPDIKSLLKQLSSFSED